MWKRVWLGLMVSLVAMSGALAQSLTELFTLLNPSLTIAEFRDLTGLRCDFPEASTQWSTFYCEGRFPTRTGHGFDALGGFFDIQLEVDQDSPCAGANLPAALFIERIERRTSDSVEILIHLQTCQLLETDGGGNPVFQETVILNMSLDPIHGHLYLAANSRVFRANAFSQKIGIVRVSGLPTLLDIIPTFQPASETLSWVAPKHPEALPAADRFMVYAGDIAALRQDRDFTRAVPVDCQVPDVGVPIPGEFLSILDPLQVEPGQASYAIVGVEYQGRLRFGRQSMGNVLRGREPLQFLTCS